METVISPRLMRWPSAASDGGTERRKAMETYQNSLYGQPFQLVTGGQNAERQWRRCLAFSGLLRRGQVTGGQNAERQWRPAPGQPIASAARFCDGGTERRKAMETTPRMSALASFPRVTGGQNAERQWRHSTIPFPSITFGASDGGTERRKAMETFASFSAFFCASSL